MKNLQDKELGEKIASLLIASTLFTSQISDSGGKTLNFNTYQEHVSKEIEEFKSYILSRESALIEEIIEEIKEWAENVRKRLEQEHDETSPIFGYNLALDDFLTHLSTLKQKGGAPKSNKSTN